MPDDRRRGSRRGAVVDGQVTGEMPAVVDGQVTGEMPAVADGPSRRGAVPPYGAPPQPPAKRGKPTRADRAQARKARAEQARAEKAHAEQARAEQARAEQARAEQARTERTRAERTRAERTRAERTRAERTRTEPPSTEQPRTERTSADQTRTGRGRPGQADRTRAEPERTPRSAPERDRPEQAGRAPSTRTQARSGPPRKRGGVPPEKAGAGARAGAPPRGGTGDGGRGKTSLREQLRQVERLRLITLICVAVVLLGAIPAFFGIQYLTRDPAFRAMDALKLPSWAAQHPEDGAAGSRWCIGTCRVRQRVWESERDTTSTVNAYHEALQKAGWKRWQVSGCPVRQVRGEYSCWRRDAYTLDLWVRLPDCRRKSGAGGESGVRGNRCPGSLVTVVVRNAGADRRLR